MAPEKNAGGGEGGAGAAKVPIVSGVRVLTDSTYCID